jgi:hypothetical protein
MKTLAFYVHKIVKLVLLQTDVQYVKSDIFQAQMVSA